MGQSIESALAEASLPSWMVAFDKADVITRVLKISEQLEDLIVDFDDIVLASFSVEGEGVSTSSRGSPLATPEGTVTRGTPTPLGSARGLQYIVDRDDDAARHVASVVGETATAAAAAADNSDPHRFSASDDDESESEDEIDTRRFTTHSRSSAFAVGTGGGFSDDDTTGSTDINDDDEEECDSDENDLGVSRRESIVFGAGAAALLAAKLHSAGIGAETKRTASLISIGEEERSSDSAFIFTCDRTTEYFTILII